MVLHTSSLDPSINETFQLDQLQNIIEDLIKQPFQAYVDVQFY